MSYYSNSPLSTKQLVRALIDARSHHLGEAPQASRQRQRRLSESEIELLIAVYAGGAVAKDLAIQFQVHRHTVTALLVKRGIAIRRVGLIAHEVAEAARLYRDGWSLARLGTKFGVDPSTVWRALLKIGVVMRSPNAR